MSDPKKPIVIDKHACHEIRDIAIKKFHEHPEFGGLHGGELQALLITMALQTWLKPKGVDLEVTFDIKPERYRY